MNSVTKGILLILAASLGTFVITFLAIFVPMLIHDVHVAPHDGQNGMAGFLLGVPVAFIAALIGTILVWRWVVKQGWFAGPLRIDDDPSKRS